MMASQDLYLILDQQNKAGVVETSAKNVFHTQGKAAYIVGRPAILCQKFHNGYCPVTTRCPYMHVNPKFIREKRNASENLLKCCHMHDNTKPDDNRRVIVTHTTAGGTEFQSVLPICRFATSKPLTRSSKDTAFIEANTNKICRLHVESKCSFGPKCSHFHICRDTWQQYFADGEDETTVTEVPSQTSSITSFAPQPQAPCVVVPQQEEEAELEFLISTVTNSPPAVHPSTEISSVARAMMQQQSAARSPKNGQRRGSYTRPYILPTTSVADRSKTDIGNSRKNSQSRCIPFEDLISFSRSTTTPIPAM